MSCPGLRLVNAMAERECAALLLFPPRELCCCETFCTGVSLWLWCVRATPSSLPEGVRGESVGAAECEFCACPATVLDCSSRLWH